MKRVLLTTTLALTALAGVGCGPQYQAITFTLRNTPPTPVEVDDHLIEIPVGIAASIHAELESGTNIEYVDEPLELISQDRDVLLVEPSGGERNFVLVGVAVGETCLAVEVDHAEEDCISVRVIAPPQ